MIYVIDFDPIRVYTCLALQNDHQILNFVKEIYVIAKKWPQMVEKWPFLKLKFSFFFLPKLKTPGNEKNVFYVVAFDPLKIQTHSAPQNDH